MGLAVDAQGLEESAVVLVRPEVGRVKQKPTRLEAEATHDARIARGLFMQQGQWDADGLLGTNPRVGKQRLAHILGNTHDATRACDRVANVALTVQALLRRKELGIAEVLQVVDDRDARHTRPPEERHREGTEEQVGTEISGDMPEATAGPQPAVR